MYLSNVSWTATLPNCSEFPIGQQSSTHTYEVIYAVGDIHGELGKLHGLLPQLSLTPDDTLVFIGDYIDRGPDTKGVIELMIDLMTNRPNTVFLRGNHEQMMLDTLAFFRPEEGRQVDPDSSLMWFSNGGDATINSYPNVDPSWYNRIPKEHWDFVRATQIEYSTRQFHFVHAGVLPSGVKWDHKRWDARLWIREPFLISEEDFGRVVVFGHTPLKRPLIEKNKIGIDTGVAYGGPLTAVGLDDTRPYDPRLVRIFQA